MIASDEVTDELLEIVKEMIKQEELEAVIKNLNTLGRDRIANDEEEVYIIAFFARENLRWLIIFNNNIRKNIFLYYTKNVPSYVFCIYHLIMLKHNHVSSLRLYT